MFLKPKRPISPVHRVPHYSFKTDISSESEGPEEERSKGSNVKP